MPTVNLTQRQVRVLQGLFYGPSVISATERSDYEIMDLLRHGYATTKYGTFDVVVWMITPHGKNYLAQTNNTPSAADQLV
jgi:hypothetical protein